VRVRVRNGLATLVGVPVAALDVLGTLLQRTSWPAPAPAKANANARRAKSKPAAHKRAP
jgi:hypothetical protein